MKRIALAAAFSLATTSAFAGNIAEPVMEPEVIAEETSSSAGAGILLPVLAIVLVAAAVAIAD
ncbi:hypothetical protein DDZ14_05295 [Maritimibacter sp. 55A14]|uniref:hypothetical protein n=1 Tax=Maritimibacter sp. 55A14 TaxID=2174844 RepID=UPI000D60BE28|nr:hypothetical protein [Maritimibacter sp. 55A14]PWE33602.1 hypothetical protein DDZ14_05295 [Maritimibacter sp. 55A14]